MADQRVAATDVGDHPRRNLAGIGALLVRIDVLRAELQAPGAVMLDQFAQVGHRREDRDAHAFRPGRGDFVQQAAREHAIAMQLPVPCHDPLAHLFLLLVREV